MAFVILLHMSSFSKQIWVVPPLNPSKVFSDNPFWVLSYDWSPHFDSPRNQAIPPKIPRAPSPAINNDRSVRWIIKSKLSLILRVNVVLNRTVVVHSDLRFFDLCGSHLQSLVIDLIGQLCRDQYHQLTFYNSLSLWRWLSHRLSKFQSLSTTMQQSCHD